MGTLSLAVVEDQVMCPLPLRVNTVSVNARVVGEEIIVTYTASANVASDVTVGLEGGGRNIIKLGKAQASGTVPAELHGKTVKTILYVGSEDVSFDKEFEYRIDPLVEIPKVPAKPVNGVMVMASLEDGALVLRSTADHAPASDLQISLRINGQVMATFVHRKNVREETAAAPAALAGKTCAVVLDAVNGVAGAQQEQTYQYVLRVANVVVPELPKPIGFLQDFIPAGNEPLGTEILLADKRDNEKYRCIKAADGKWWLGDHLRYKNTGSSKPGTYDTHLLLNLFRFGIFCIQSTTLYKAQGLFLFDEFVQPVIYNCRDWLFLQKPIQFYGFNLIEVRCFFFCFHSFFETVCYLIKIFPN